MRIGEKKKSSRSNGSGGNNCVQIERTETGVLMRDTKNPNQEALSFTNAEWNAFVEGVQAGEFAFTD